MRQPVDTPCDRSFTAVHNSGRRSVKQIKWVVLHDEEAPTARSAAAYFATAQSGGSAHLCVDDNECYRTLRNDQIPWGAPGANTNGFHIEQAGFARWSTVIWKKHLWTLKRAAYKTALHCKLFGIPPVFVAAADLKAGKRGVTTHAECSKAFGGNHTDPGPGWPRWLFMRYVRQYMEGPWPE